MPRRSLPRLLLATATAIVSSDDKPDPAARFAGEWVVQSVEREGVAEEARLPPDSCLLTIRGDKVEFFIASLAAGLEEKGTFSIVGAAPGPLKVDVRVVEKSGSDLGKQPDRRFVRKELWRITDKGQFQRCMPLEPSGPRPESFATRKGDGTGLMSFGRR